VSHDQKNRRRVTVQRDGSVFSRLLIDADDYIAIAE
jgi:hypothetical protein